jgi:hypothetical protein
MRPHGFFPVWITIIILLNACSFITNNSAINRPISETYAFDCSSIQSLPPDSPEAQSIVTDFIADFREAFPTEYMDFYKLHAVDKAGDYVTLQGMVTQEETNVILIQYTSHGYVVVSQFLATGAHPVTRKQILDHFEKELTPDLFNIVQCIEFNWLSE